MEIDSVKKTVKLTVKSMPKEIGWEKKMDLPMVKYSHLVIGLVTRRVRLKERLMLMVIGLVKQMAKQMVKLTVKSMPKEIGLVKQTVKLMAKLMLRVIDWEILMVKLTD